ncbi:MAG: Gfo/Idh/MocA family oxidoreductase [Synergistaceae bacterium]|jgi:predicted dehydrogenase|nr:Gfo/Idh/MocA family oxidoreductase [Synergistaceae bacterium]
MRREPFKIGFLGGGISSAIGYSHFAASRMDGRFVLEAGCFSRRGDINRDSAELYGVDGDRAYRSWGEMLERERERLDAVVVLLPTPSHFDAVSGALQSGVQVICDKSLCMNLDESVRLRDICGSGRHFLAVTYNYAGYPMIRELRGMIQRGELGEIRSFVAEMPQESYVRGGASPQKWRLDEKSPSLISLDLLTHLHHMIGYLLGERALSVSARQDSFGNFPGVVDDIKCLVTYSGGVSGSYWASKSAMGYRNGMRVRVYGSRGSAEWVQENPEQLEVAFPDGRKNSLDRGQKLKTANEARYNRFKAGHPAGYLEGFANLYSDIADSLDLFLSGATPRGCEFATVEDEVERMRFIEAVAISSSRGKWVDVI